MRQLDAHGLSGELERRAIRVKTPWAPDCSDGELGFVCTEQHAFRRYTVGGLVKDRNGIFAGWVDRDNCHRTRWVDANHLRALREFPEFQLCIP